MARFDFPKDFIWGTATAAYQIEGAHDVNGKGESIWDRFSHTEGKIKNGDTGDTACGHFGKFTEDVALMRDIGLKGYRYSISWPRVDPEGNGKINQNGLDFYDCLTDELLRKNIDPAVTLYHWDLPLALHEKGGWLDKRTIDAFGIFAEAVYKRLGDRVKKWITINEPSTQSYFGYITGEQAPGISDNALGLQVAHNLLVAHTKAVEIYRSLNLKGEIGISLFLSPAHAATMWVTDLIIAKVMDGLYNRWYLDAVLKGTYPKDTIKMLQSKFKSPVVKNDEMDAIKNTKVDFVGVNYYIRNILKYSRSNPVIPYEVILPPKAEITEMGWEVYPKGIYEVLKRIRTDYGNPKVYITENGIACKDSIIENGMVIDDDRIAYLKSHLSQVWKAISEGSNVKGYYHWSFMDNFEWSHGNSKRFGIVRTDFKTLERSLKKSAYWYGDVIKNNGFSI